MEIQKVIWSLPYSTDLAGDTWIEGRVEIVAKDIPDYVYRARIRIHHFSNFDLNLILLTLIMQVGKIDKIVNLIEKTVLTKSCWKIFSFHILIKIVKSK